MIFSPENILFQNKNISNHHEKHSQLEKELCNVEKYFDKYFQNMQLEYVICEHCYKLNGERAKSTFETYQTLKSRFSIEASFATNLL